jgi:hypothetical protein
MNVTHANSRIDDLPQFPDDPLPFAPYGPRRSRQLPGGLSVSKVLPRASRTITTLLPHRFRAARRRNCHRVTGFTDGLGRLLALAKTVPATARYRSIGPSGWLAAGLAFLVRCWHPVSLWTNTNPDNGAKCPLLSPPVSSRHVLAMQKVEGSSPFIRFAEPAGNGGFSVPRLGASSLGGRVVKK